MPRRLELSRLGHLASALSAFGPEPRRDEPLALHTSFGIGGPAALLLSVGSVRELAAALAAAAEAGIETLLLGGGTNLLVSDDGLPGLAIRLDLFHLEVDRESGRVIAGAGVPAARLVEETIAAGLAGLEFAAGLPGTVGGAVAGNAGCFGSSFGERLAGATVVGRDGTIEEVADPRLLAFDYRCSSLADLGLALASAEFRLEPGDRAALEETAASHLASRAERHPPRGTRTAGSYFKNLPPAEPGGRRRAAGELLDRAGARGLAVGDAAVFEGHANIIVNRGAATARDVLELARKMSALVRRRFSVELEPEVRFVGPRPAGHWG